MPQSCLVHVLVKDVTCNAHFSRKCKMESQCSARKSGESGVSVSGAAAVGKFSRLVANVWL